MTMQFPHNGIRLERAADIPIRAIDWPFPGWLASGKLHILAGAPGTGKTSVAILMASVLSNGGTQFGIWSDGSIAPFASSIIWTSEDGIEDTLMPRLFAAGANLSHVFVLRGMTEYGNKRPFDFDIDLPKLVDEIERIGNVRLVVIDSIVQAIHGDAHKNHDVRRSLEPLVKIAERYGIAIIGITHVSKGTKGKDPLERINGSIAFSAVARLVLMTNSVENTGVDGNNPPMSVLVRAKSNIGPSNGGYVFQLVQQPVQISDMRVTYATKVLWQQQIPGTAEDILKYAAGNTGSSASGKLEQAIIFLRQILAAGPTPCANVEAQAHAVGISWATLRRARESIGVLSEKKGDMQGNVANFWSLPSLGMVPQVNFGNYYAPFPS